MEENKRVEKLCLFFASDYHFEMISLPYISENLKSDKNIIMMTENNLDGTVDELLSKINLSKDDKEQIFKVDWKNDDVNKFRQIKSANEEGKETIIFVKGKENYINSINKNIENWINVKDMKVIDCYDINEVHNDVSNIAKRYNRVLSTSGVEKLI